MATKVKNNRIYADVELFKGDYCARLSPDLLQKREIFTQTDDESTSECSLNSADTILKESQNSFDEDESLIRDEQTDILNSSSCHILSSEEDNHEPSEKLFTSKEHSSTPKKRSPLLVEYIPKPIDDSSSSIEENSPILPQYLEPNTSTNKSPLEECSITLKNPSPPKNESTSEDCSVTSVENPNVSKNKSTFEDRSLTPVENPSTSRNKFTSRNSTISSSEEIIPPSPVHTIISSDSTISMKLTRQKLKKNRKKIIQSINDDSTDNQSDTEPVNKQRTVQRRTKKTKSSTTKKTSPKKPRVKGKKKIVMNKVVYPSSYPTSAEESLSDDPLDISKGTNLSSLSSKLLADKKVQSKKSGVISSSEDDSEE